MHYTSWMPRTSASSLLALSSSLLLLWGCSQTPGPELSPEVLEFGTIEPGEAVYGLAQLWNPGPEISVQIVVQPSGGIFSSAEYAELTLPSANLAEIEVSALGVALGPQQGVLTVVWEGGSAETLLSADVALAVVDLDHDGVPAGEDCDDTDPTVRPGAEEVCDGVDTDCDGELDAEESDLDEDGQSECQGDCDDTDASVSESSPEICDGLDNDCDGVAGFDSAREVDVDGDGSLSCADCDDADAANFPGNSEQCDSRDNDCNGAADADPAGEVDVDLDGSLSCNDCNDDNPAQLPGAVELCDGLDTDCNGSADADAAGEVDADGDGALSCRDCDDSNAAVSPNFVESCDGIDNDCDGVADADPAGEIDGDGDGSLSCVDCDDAAAANFPGNPEVCDGADNDCNDVADADAAGEIDGDGDGSLSCVDCDDGAAGNFPGNAEICDGADNDCNGAADADPGGELDADNDQFLSCEECDDGNPAVSPAATEVCDNVDNDCDGIVDENAVFQEFFLKGINGPEAELWMSDLAGGFSTTPQLFDPNGAGSVRGAVAGDFDDDGYLDFILTRGFNVTHASLYRSDCEGGFDIIEQNYIGGLQLQGRSNPHTVADLDQDGDLDVIGWDWSDGEGWVWLNDGDGTTWVRLPASATGSHPFDLNWSPTSSSFREAVAVPPVDVTGDGYPDLVECINISSGGIGLSASSCQIHTGVGDGTFTSTLAPEFGVLRRVNGIALADFDGDGDIDMLGGLDDDGDAGQVWYWSGGPILPSGLGSEAFDVNEPDTGALNQDLPGYGWMSPYDWNGDGAMDVLVSYMDPHNSVDRTLVVALNDGNANFTVHQVGFSNHAYGSGAAEVQDIIAVPVWP
jgi:hypothetical protein